MTQRNPPIVILGSSLTLAAPRRLGRPDVYQEEISKASGLDLDVCCMAVPGAIASDQDFVLSELLAHHKKPKLIVYTYAPRDFMDNTIDEGKIAATPMRRVLTFINRRNSFLPGDFSWTAVSQCIDKSRLFFGSCPPPCAALRAHLLLHKSQGIRTVSGRRPGKRPGQHKPHQLVWKKTVVPKDLTPGLTNPHPGEPALQSQYADERSQRSKLAHWHKT